MRKLTYLFLAGVLLMTASCKKYLNTVPDDILTVNDIYTSRANVDQYMANIYSALPNELQQRFAGNQNSGVWEGASDEAKFNWDFVYANQMNLSVWSNTDDNVKNYWDSYYQAIRNATDFMNRIDAATAADLTADLKKEYKAEARGLRSLYYFFLLRTYGPVVLLGDQLISADASTESVRLPRTPFDNCVTFVTTQLDSAYLDLPVSSAATTQGRLNKGVVKAYKEQMLMLAASPLYNGNTDYANFKNADGTHLINQTYDQNKWKLAADAAKAFMDEFPAYKLYISPNAPADSTLAAYINCKDVMLDNWNSEWIFARSNSGSYMRYDKTPKHVGSPSDQSGAAAMGVTQTMVDAYFMKNGLSIDDPKSKYVSAGFSMYQSPSDASPKLTIQGAHSTFNQWVNREPRFYVGVTYDSSYWLYQDPGNPDIITAFQYNGNSGRSQSTSDVTPTGYAVRKNCASSDGTRGALLLRLSNIYLDYAEALNEYDPSNPDILIYLNKIRAHAGVPQYGVTSSLYINDTTGLPVQGGIPVPATQADMRTAIRKERRVELAFENVRYFDTRRWKIAPQTDAGPFYGMNMYVNGSDFYKKTLVETRIFQQRDYFFPIPNSEVLKDNLMVQNPGW
ncbi:MAG TPA: RagB/SusD family nutrient uptake outer membrane protein [Puia sp.]|nr:RagB/SusD family nutrient uptake outer membrane protein [Puia sp.]